MKQLRTARDVVAAVGGLGALCDLTGANKKQASHWQTKAKAFPASTYKVMTEELTARDFEAPARLWRQKEKRRAA